MVKIEQRGVRTLQHHLTPACDGLVDEGLCLGNERLESLREGEVLVSDRVNLGPRDTNRR